MHVRTGSPTDAPAIVRLFYDTVHRISSRDYSTEQVNAWAPAVPDARLWADVRMPNRLTLVAEESGKLIGFAEFEASGHISALFVHHAHQRRGAGRALLAELEHEAFARGLGHLSAEVSLTARSFFEGQGFRIQGEETVVRRGVALRRLRMDKRLVVAG